MGKTPTRDFNRHPFRVFLSYYRPHGKLLTLDLFMAVIGVGADLVFPLMSRNALQRLLPEQKYRAFFTVMGVLLLAYLFRTLTIYIVTVYGHYLGVRVEADMREDIFRKVQSLSFSFFDRNRTGKLMSRMTTDLFEITELALVLIALVPVLILIMVTLRTRLRQSSLGVKAEMAEINTAVESGVSGVRTVKAFANENAELDKFELSNSRFRRAKRQYYKIFGLFNSSIEFTMALMQLTVITAGGYFIMKGKMDLADLVAFSLYVSTFTMPIRKLVSFFEMFQSGSAGFLRFLEIMRTEPEVKDAPDAVDIGAVRGEIEYKDVSFHYGSGPEVLHGVNLHIAPGETLALVGPSGSGKTTMSQLLPRFYDVTDGAVLVDGKDIRTVTQDSLRRNIGIIQQDVFLFADTIRENIRYGRPDATDEEVEQAARLAAIHEEICEMPQGYDSFVGERGVMLSGGQKQRVAIARVFLKNPPILVLDEATSALDSVTEQAIQSSLEQLSRGRTSIVVAHRLSTVRKADHIAVVGESGITEYGTHAQLLERRGEYAALWNAQKLS